ncbi:MAG: pectate lyase [Paludibacter sp.]|nr:pectate lyase [Paludibacter sp.]
MKLLISRNTTYYFAVSITLIALFLFSGNSSAQKPKEEQKFTTIDYAPFADNTGHWYMIADKHNLINALPDKPRYKPTEITSIADNLLLFQKDNGGWPKNYDFFAILTPEQATIVKAAKGETNTTFDNGNTYTQIAALAIAYQATKIEKYKTGCIKGLGFILQSQYKNGGWPQYYPIEKNNYSSHITFNDGAMMGIMELLRAILDGQPQYSFIDSKLRSKLQVSYNKGLDCILKTQINDAGKPTAWCQQYDEVTLQPAWARKFEPASICNKESSEIVLFLMSIDHPSKEIIDAVQNAVTWFDESIIHNTRVKTVQAPKTLTPYKVSSTDKVVVNDSTAPAIWTRYYELKTHRPMFCNRDSKIVYSLAEVARERRDGYGWYNYEPQKILNKYPKWQKKWAPENDVLKK